MSRFDPHLAILPEAQRAIWPLFAPAKPLGLVLYGGTAVALRLGHRNSVDFDFFTEKPLDFKQIERSFAFMQSAQIVQSQPDTLSVLAPTPAGNVQVSFFGSITNGRVGTPELTKDGVLEVASPLDLLATELKVIQQRLEAKDYSDIAAILRSGLRLEDGMAAAAELYTPSLQPSEAVKALTYFEGGDLKNLSAVDKNLLSRAASKIYRIPAIALRSSSLSAIVLT
jgi:hypothetical protein